MAYLRGRLSSVLVSPSLSLSLCFPYSLSLPPLITSVVASTLFAMFLVMYKHETNLVNNYTPSSTLPTNSTVGSDVGSDASCD